MHPAIDKIDLQIIHLLKQNGRMPNTEIAGQVNLSETAVRKRLKRLIDDEMIQIVAVVNQHKMGNQIEGNIKLRADIKKIDHVKQQLNELKDLWYIAYLTGAADFDVEFHVSSQDALRRLIEQINAIDGVAHAETSIRLQLLKNRYDWEKPRYSSVG